MKSKLTAVLMLMLLLLAFAASGEEAAVETGTVYTFENEKLILTVNEKDLGLTVTEKETGYVLTSAVDPSIKMGSAWKGFVSSTLTIEYTEGTATGTKKADIYSFAPEITATPLETGVDAVVDFTAIGQRIRLEIRLLEDSFTITVPDGGIEEYEFIKPEDLEKAQKEADEAYQQAAALAASNGEPMPAAPAPVDPEALPKSKTAICGLYLAPLFGATHLDEKEGYLLVPDGAGALIDFTDGEGEDEPTFTKRVYGMNIGVDKPIRSKLARDEHEVTLPLYGISNTTDQVGVLAVIESGAEAAQIMANPSEYKNLKFNWATAYFNIREVYLAQLTRSKSLEKREADAYIREMSMRYYILSGEDSTYSGMARRYKKALEDEGFFDDSCDVSYRTRLDFLGGETKEQLLGYGVEKMTTVSQMNEIYTSLTEKGVSEPLVIYRGWRDGGLTLSLGDDDVSLEGALGDEDELTEFANDVREAGGKFLLEIDPVKANPENSYNMRSGIVKNLGQTVAQENTGKSMFPYLYYVTPWNTAEILEEASDEWAEHVDGFALTTVPNVLFSHYSGGENHMRGETMEIYREAISDMEGELAMENPFAAHYGDMNYYLDLPLSGSSFSYVSQEVPFVSMVLSGHVPVYTTWLNFESNRDQALLKLVEYGVYPSYLLTYEDVQGLNYTNSNEIYSAKWTFLEDTILETEEMLRGVFAHTEGASMIDHEQLMRNFVRVTYDNGVQIYVNYRKSEMTFDGVHVPAESFVIVKGGEVQ